MVEAGALWMAVQAVRSIFFAIHDGVVAASTSRLLESTRREVEELATFDRAYLPAALFELALLALSYFLLCAIRSVVGG